MNLVEIAKRAKGKTGLRFRKTNTHIVLTAEASGHFFVAGQRMDLDLEKLLADYEIICDHPPKLWSRLSEEETGLRKCLACDREIQLKGFDMAPAIPEKISPLKLTKEEQEKEDFLIKHMSTCRGAGVSPFILPNGAIA